MENKLKNTRRIAIKSQIGKNNWKLVSDLANDRLVVTGYDQMQKQPTVEVVHEILIKGWKPFTAMDGGRSRFS